MSTVRALRAEDESSSEDQFSWRFEQLLQAGYPLDLADIIAVRNDIDLHEACDLVVAGCKPELAARILL